jgi:hypothetical protein
MAFYFGILLAMICIALSVLLAYRSLASDVEFSRDGVFITPLFGSSKTFQWTDVRQPIDILQRRRGIRVP